jgi:hypothetical protein
MTNRCAGNIRWFAKHLETVDTQISKWMKEGVTESCSYLDHSNNPLWWYPKKDLAGNTKRRVCIDPRTSTRRLKSRLILYLNAGHLDGLLEKKDLFLWSTLGLTEWRC